MVAEKYPLAGTAMAGVRGNLCTSFGKAISMPLLLLIILFSGTVHGQFFLEKKDSAFVKMNGQIIETLDYKGNNSFEGGLGRIKAQFEITGDRSVRVKTKILTGPDKYVSVVGNKIHKYHG